MQARYLLWSTTSPAWLLDST